MRSPLAAILGLALLSACSPGADVPPPAAARPVLTQLVVEQRPEDVRTLPGIVRSRDRADLSFRVAGRVKDVAVGIGARVEAGTVLARLDPAPFALRRRQAEAAVDRAKAVLTERRRRHDAQASLFQRGAASRQTLDAAVAELATAESALAEAKAALALAERDLAESEIRAPFAGTVAAREIEPFVEVQSGQTAIRLDGAGATEVTANVPAALLPKVAVGTKATIAIGNPSITLAGTVARIGGRGETGLSFPVAIDLDGPDPMAVRPGMVAEVRLHLGAAVPGIFLPPGAVVPGLEAARGHVFVVDATGGRVARRPVRLGVPTDHGVPILEGVTPGERIVSVAAAFLVDGQAVKPLAAQ